MEVFNEFGQLADMVYKLPRFVENEFAIEKDKLDSYFPADDPSAAHLRAMRATMEGAKLGIVFPRLLSQAGVLLVVSLYETHLVRAVNQSYYPTKPACGLAACRKLLEAKGHSLDSLRFAQQVDLVLLVRHSVIHLSGYIDRLRKRNELKDKIASKVYLMPWQEENGIEINKALLSVENDRLGERLVISHDYAHLCCSQLRDNLCELLDSLDC